MRSVDARVARLLENPVLGPEQGGSVQMGGLGVRFMIGGEEADGGFALVEHPIAPKALGAPMHTHSNEDEYSYILEGVVGLQLGDEIVEARSGDLVFKPRGVPHAFWNAGEEPARLLEVISPAGFEKYFEEMAPLLPPNVEQPDVAAIGQIQQKYGLEMDMESRERLIAQHGLAAPG